LFQNNKNRRFSRRQQQKTIYIQNVPFLPQLYMLKRGKTPQTRVFRTIKVQQRSVFRMIGFFGFEGNCDVLKGRISRKTKRVIENLGFAFRFFDASARVFVGSD
jgi:hypothetical protein